MSDGNEAGVGSISWFDLTVGDAERLRDFYGRVVGWRPTEVDMGGYSDFNMNAPETGRTVAGICHARNTNSDLPSQWLIYITVSDLDDSMEGCRELGGRVLAGPKSLGNMGRYCVIEDPEGAVAALFEPTS
ncbi:MAG: VOC family protein [Acidobacteriota bacterium]|nr:VOC family protein [Acidobacteriota bacterium]